MKIEGQANIADTFSAFHNGSISQFTREDDDLVLEIEIQYLARRIKDHFRKFFIRLEGAHSLQLITWPGNMDTQSRVLNNLDDIFESSLDIHEGTIHEGRLQVMCGQSSMKFDYCGGELYLEAISAEVTDEGGKHYSLAELTSMSETYWAEWEAKNLPVMR